MFADLETGATSLRIYEPTIIHGLAQTEDYCRSLVRAVASDGEPVNIEATVAGRLRRQEQAESAGTSVDIIMEEIAVLRMVAPPTVMAEQLRHLANLASSGRITLRVLPVDAEFVEARSPREAFMLCTYADDGDPTVALVETVTGDDVRTKANQVAAYERLYDRCRTLALPPDASVDFIAEAAETVTAKQPTKRL